MNFENILTENDFSNEFRDIEDCFLKDSLYASGERTAKLDLITMESYSTKNKENICSDK